jgi:hypothetical protein
MDGKNFAEVDLDLGVKMQSDQKWNRQCTKAMKTANNSIGIIRRSFRYLKI